MTFSLVILHWPLEYMKMTSALLNMLDHEDTGNGDNLYQWSETNSSVMENSMERSRQMSQSSIFSEGAVQGFHENVHGSTLIGSGLAQDPSILTHSSLPSSLRNESFEYSYHRTFDHEVHEPPRTLSDPIGRSTHFQDRVASSEKEHQGLSLSSVMEESQHAQNWSPSSWQPSTAMPNTFLPKI